MPHDLHHADRAPGAAALRLRYGAELAAPPDWNAVLDTLLAHRSVRDYLPDALPDGALEQMVAAAQSAASSSNLQVWSVIAVEDAERKARLAALAGGQRHIVAAPLFLVWLADLSRDVRIGEAHGTKLEGADFLESFIVALVDAALAAQNAAAAAESLGLGICYIGALRNKPEAVAAELGLPKLVMPAFGMTVGHPDPAGGASVKPRLPQSVVVHREQYSARPEAEGIAAYDDRLRAFQEATRMRPVGWSHSVVDRLRSGASLMGRDRMREALRNLGFELR